MGLIQKVNYLLLEMENEFKIAGPNSKLLWGTFAKRCNYVFGMIAIILSSPHSCPFFDARIQLLRQTLSVPCKSDK